MDFLENFDWDQILTALKGMASCGTVRDLIEQLSPLKTTEQAIDSFGQIRDAQIALSRQQSKPQIQSIDNSAHWLERLNRNAVLKTSELREVRSFLEDTLSVKSFLMAAAEAPWCQNNLNQLLDGEPPLSAINHLITREDEIRTDASPKLFNLTQEKNQAIQQVQNILDHLVKEHQMEEVLQERFVTTREGRWVLPIKSGMKHSFDGIIHATSQTRQTVFMEPQETVPLNNRLRAIDLEIEAEIERLLIEVSDYLSSLKADFAQTQQLLIQTDLVLAKAQLALELKASACDFSSQELLLKDLRHPLLTLQGISVVANTVRLTRNQPILLLSGPNAGGKTVLLKAIGLAAHMARCGLFICAEEGSQLPFLTTLQTAIGDAQNVDHHLSTFAAHLQRLNGMAQLKGFHNLLLIDEICGSTDPEEGSALARSFIEEFVRRELFVVVTSHLGPLKTGWKNSQVINGSLAFDSEKGSPTYQLIMGVAGPSLALQTARRVGVSPLLVDRAFQLLSPEAKALHNHLQEFEEMKQNLQKTQAELNQQLRQAQSQKEKYQMLVEQFRREKDEWMRKYLKKSEKKVDDLIATSQAKNVLDRHTRLHQIKQELPQVVRVRAGEPTSPSISTISEFAKVAPQGTRVLIKSLNRMGIVESKPNTKGEVSVISDSMHIMVSWTDLRIQGATFAPANSALARPEKPGYGECREVDLRGKRVEEAIETLDQQMDSATLNSEDRIKIIHGHGTNDILKKAIRAHLSRSPYVKKWNAGGPTSGGDGISWVDFK